MNSLRARIGMLFSLPVLLAPLNTLAATEPNDELDAYFRVFWGLCIVLALILVLFALFRKRLSLVNPRSTKAIKVLEIQPLAPRKSICLVEVRGREYLVGVANESITLLADLKSQSAQATSFQEVLHSENEARQ